MMKKKRNDVSLMYKKNNDYLAFVGLYVISYFSAKNFWWFTEDVSHETFTDVGLINVKVIFSGIAGAESEKNK